MGVMIVLIPITKKFVKKLRKYQKDILKVSPFTIAPCSNHKEFKGNDNTIMTIRYRWFTRS